MGHSEQQWWQIENDASNSDKGRSRRKCGKHWHERDGVWDWENEKARESENDADRVGYLDENRRRKKTWQRNERKVNKENRVWANWVELHWECNEVESEERKKESEIRDSEKERRMC